MWCENERKINSRTAFARPRLACGDGTHSKQAGASSKELPVFFPAPVSTKGLCKVVATYCQAVRKTSLCTSRRQIISGLLDGFTWVTSYPDHHSGVMCRRLPCRLGPRCARQTLSYDVELLQYGSVACHSMNDFQRTNGPYIFSQLYCMPLYDSPLNSHPLQSRCRHRERRTGPCSKSPACRH